MALSLQFTPSPESVRAVEEHARILARITQPDPEVMEAVAEAIRDGFAESFESEGAASGFPWAQLAPWTVSERERQGFGGHHPILVRSGGYRDSFVNPGAANHVSRRETDGMGWLVAEGSSDERAGTLEVGGFTETGHIVPPRPVTALSESAEAEIGRRIAAWLTRALP